MSNSPKITKIIVLALGISALGAPSLAFADDPDPTAPQEGCPAAAGPAPDAVGNLSAVMDSVNQAKAVSDPATTITRDGRYIYYRTPWADVTDSQKAAVWKESLGILADALAKAMPGKLSSQAELQQMLTAFPTMDPLLKQLQDLNNQDSGGIRLPKSLAPTAIMVQMNGNLSGNIGVGLSGGAGVGAVIVPTYVQKVDPITGKVVDKHFEYNVGLYSMVDGGVGLGGGGGASGKVGVGLIFGQLPKPEDFRGVAAGLVESVAALGGTQLSEMALHRLGNDNWVDNVFVMAQVEAGPVAEISVHGTVKLVMGPNTFFSSLMGGLQSGAGSTMVQGAAQ